MVVAIVIVTQNAKSMIWQVINNDNDAILNDNGNIDKIQWEA